MILTIKYSHLLTIESFTNNLLQHLHFAFSYGRVIGCVVRSISEGKIGTSESPLRAYLRQEVRLASFRWLESYLHFLVTLKNASTAFRSFLFLCRTEALWLCHNDDPSSENPGHIRFCCANDFGLLRYAADWDLNRMSIMEACGWRFVTHDWGIVTRDTLPPRAVFVDILPYFELFYLAWTNINIS